MPEQSRKIVVIAGPTAGGKTAFSLALARLLQERGQACEILVADSISHYRGFDIGAAKPSEAEQAEIAHHLLNVCDGNEDFSAGDFVRQANPILERLIADGIQPLIVGGSGFYLRAVLQGMAVEGNAARKQSVRQRLEQEAAELGLAKLYERMLVLDPALKEKIHENDRYRIIRALEAMELSGRSWSQLNQEARRREPRWPHHYFCLNPSWQELEARIQDRAAAMIARGLLEEVQRNLAAGVPLTAKPFHSVGYRQCLEYLNLCDPPPGHERPQTCAELVAAIAQATRRLARAQLTWFKGQAPHAIWLEGSANQDQALAKIQNFLGGPGN